MGTRGLWGFVSEGVEKLTYNHFDSYPSGLGTELLAFVRDHIGTHGLESFKADARSLELIDEDVKPTEAQKQKARDAGVVDLSVSEQSEDDWYCLLRNAQGDPAKLLQVGMMSDGSSFALDSLFCEWAYVIDLDAERFEVYRGFQKAAHTQGRFADRRDPDNAHMDGPREPGKCFNCGMMKPDWDSKFCPQGYYPIRLLASFDLNALPSNERFEARIEAIQRIENPEDYTYAGADEELTPEVMQEMENIRNGKDPEPEDTREVGEIVQSIEMRIEAITKQFEALLNASIAVLDSQGGVQSMGELAQVVSDLTDGASDFTDEYPKGDS